MAVKKKKTKKKTSRKKRISADKVDQLLVKVSPALQAKVNNLVAVLENTKEGRLGDLRLLGGKILMRAQEISKGLKSLRRKRKS